MIMPQMYSDKKHISHILHSACQVYSKLCKICRIHVPDNDIISCEHSFINNRIVNLVCNNCTYLQLLNTKLVKTVPVFNPKCLDVLYVVAYKVKRIIECYLVYIKYWQILGY